MAGTRWIKLDTSYLRNPKITAISRQAVMLHLASILWTADQLTDGQIPDRTLRELGQTADIEPRWGRRRAAELVETGLWVPNGDGWHIHDFEVMNPQAMRHKVEAQRKLWRQHKGLDT